MDIHQKDVQILNYIFKLGKKSMGIYLLNGQPMSGKPSFRVFSIHSNVQLYNKKVQTLAF